MRATDGSRRSVLQWLDEVVRHGYREDGLAKMLAGAPRFVAEDLVGDRLAWWLLRRPVRDRIADRAALLRRADATDALWYAGSAEPFTIDLPERRSTDAPLPQPLADAVGTEAPERPFVCELRDARLLGEDAFAVVDDHVVLETASASEMYLSFELRDLYDGLAADRSRPAAYRTYRDVLAGRASLPVPTGRASVPAPAGRASVPAPAGRTVDEGAGTGWSRSFDVATVFVPYWRNYYHWTMEFLPKIRLLERYRDATGRTPTMLVEADPPNWQLETLRLAGWDPDDCVEWAGGEARVDRLVVPMHRNRYVTPHDGQFADDFNPAPDDVTWLAERMQSNVPGLGADGNGSRDTDGNGTRGIDRDGAETSDDGTTDGDEFSRRIFLSRRDTTYRPVANEDAIASALEPLGFAPYVLTDLSLADQIRLFANAETIVSPHGAGLVNMIHATDATVVELFPEDNVEPYYFCLARQLGFDYEWAVYPTAGDATVVDADHLTALVSRVVDA